MASPGSGSPNGPVADGAAPLSSGDVLTRLQAVLAAASDDNARELLLQDRLNEVLRGVLLLRKPSAATALPPPFPIPSLTGARRPCGPYGGVQANVGGFAAGA